ncbi:MAG: hypothetical protein CME64_15365 [Halobacteriovoraceae bacterium]|nr:hypothetical protein [Halobacteriovoraceae bacterium]|tara:strand:+ start:115043 stop:115657 length:615 start_codon:yes stop_codon:yes gene_type:complete
MKDSIVKNLHWFILAYAVQMLYFTYEEKDEQYQSLIQQTPAIQSKIAREKRKLTQIEEFKKNLSSTKERVKEVVKQIEKVQRQLPTDVNDAQVQEVLGGIADKLKIKNPVQYPEAETNKGFYFAKEYVFKGRGTFLQSLIFFENLAKTERILNVKNVKITQSQEQGRGRFQIVEMETMVESFRYNENHKEKTGIDEIEAQLKVN